MLLQYTSTDTTYSEGTVDDTDRDLRLGLVRQYSAEVSECVCVRVCAVQQCSSQREDEYQWKREERNTKLDTVVELPS